jgi:hypothetical protein
MPAKMLVSEQGEAVAARRLGAVGCLAWALLVLGACLALLHPLRGHPVSLLLLALGAALVVWHVLRHEPRSGGTARALRGEPWLSASVAGVAGAGSAHLATLADPFRAGVAAALPVISGFAMVHLLRTGGPGDVARFVAGYMPGVAASAALLFTFALLAPWLGAGLAQALAAACGALLARLGTLPRAAPAPASTARADPAALHPPPWLQMKDLGESAALWPEHDALLTEVVTS